MSVSVAMRLYAMPDMIVGFAVSFYSGFNLLDITVATAGVDYIALNQISLYASGCFIYWCWWWWWWCSFL